MKHYHIYKISNAINSLLYVGCTCKSIEARWQEHRHTAHASTAHAYYAPLYVAMRQYGFDAFSQILIETRNGDNLTMLAKERYWIDKLNTLQPNGYNQMLYTLSNTDAAIIRFNAYDLKGTEYAALFSLSVAAIYQIRASQEARRTYRHVNQAHLPRNIRAYAARMGHTAIIEQIKRK